MLYAVCMAKNEFTRNEHEPKYNPENWEVRGYVNCRKNASKENYEKAFCRIYQHLTRGFEPTSKNIRLWNFEEGEVI